MDTRYTVEFDRFLYTTRISLDSVASDGTAHPELAECLVDARFFLNEEDHHFRKASYDESAEVVYVREYLPTEKQITAWKNDSQKEFTQAIDFALRVHRATQAMKDSMSWLGQRACR